MGGNGHAEARVVGVHAAEAAAPLAGARGAQGVVHGAGAVLLVRRGGEGHSTDARRAGARVQGVRNRGRVAAATALYFAYGANTNIKAMAWRCPTAVPLAPAKLVDWRLVFRCVADVERQKGAVVHGAMWRITAEDEEALDRFEGYPNLYVKLRVNAKVEGKVRPVMLYVMRQREWLEPPPGGYEHTLREGYKQFGLPQQQLDRALQEAVRESAARRPMVQVWGLDGYEWNERLRDWDVVAKPKRLHEQAELPLEHKKG